MKPSIRVLAAILLIAVAGCQPKISAVPADSATADIAPLSTAPLKLVTAKGEFPFIVEVARTEAEQARGLMGRGQLAPDRGMIFPMLPVRLASFWMKDTPSPLDIVFIAPGGRVLRIAAMTTPFSLDPIDSGGPVEAVLEIAGGRAAELGLTAGDRVNW